MVALGTAVENAFPPIPSDVMTVLAGFISRHGVTNPWLVFVSAWAGSVAGAAAVYYASLRFGRTFFTGPVGRRLLPPEALATMEREYLRLGVAGIFVCRLVPWVRSFVAPFAGLVALTPARALLPMALASALWIGGLTWLGSTLGAEWQSILAFLRQLNLGLALLGGAMAILFLILRLRARARARRDRLWAALHLAFADDPDAEARGRGDLALAGAATLIREMARGDRAIGREQLREIEACLRERWHLEGAAPLAPLESPGREGRTSGEYGVLMAGHFDEAARLGVLARLRNVLRRDGRLTPVEDRMLERAADLLGLGNEAMAPLRAGDDR
ncbi:MAG: VTT domain-containing protein [Gemmatimonadales bacterium]